MGFTEFLCLGFGYLVLFGPSVYFFSITGLQLIPLGILTWSQVKTRARARRGQSIPRKERQRAKLAVALNFGNLWIVIAPYIIFAFVPAILMNLLLARITFEHPRLGARDFRELISSEEIARVRAIILEKGERYARVLVAEVAAEVNIPPSTVDELIQALASRDLIPATYDPASHALNIEPVSGELDALRAAFENWIAEGRGGKVE